MTGGLTDWLLVAAGVFLWAWLALGYVPLLGGFLKSVLRLTFLSAPLVMVTLVGLFVFFEGRAWFASPPKPPDVSNLASASPERAPLPTVRP